MTSALAKYVWSCSNGYCSKRAEPNINWTFRDWLNLSRKWVLLDAPDATYMCLRNFISKLYFHTFAHFSGLELVLSEIKACKMTIQQRSWPFKFFSLDYVWPSVSLNMFFINLNELSRFKVHMVQQKVNETNRLMFPLKV